MTRGLRIPATFPEDSCCRLKTRAYLRHPQITSISCTSKLSSIETFPLNNLLPQKVIFYLWSSLSRPSPSVITSPTISPHLNSISLPTKSWVITSPNLLHLISEATLLFHRLLTQSSCCLLVLKTQRRVTQKLWFGSSLPSLGYQEKKLLQTIIPDKVNL